MATTADADLILKLYTLRTEETMRTARKWLTTDFQPQSYGELTAVHKSMGSQENNFYRQVMSYWEMVAAFVLRGALDPDLLIDSVSENFFLAAKVEQFQAEHKQVTGGQMMSKTHQLIAKYPAAKAKFEGALKAVAAQRTKA
jgi:hypothetical protein